jgi:hypothetical protein
MPDEKLGFLENLVSFLNSPYARCHRLFSGMQDGAAAKYCVFSGMQDGAAAEYCVFSKILRYFSKQLSTA